MAADGHPTLVQRWLWLVSRRVPLVDGTAVALRAAGQTVYLVARRGRRTLSIDVLALTEYVRRSRGTDELRALADAIDAGRVDGGREVAATLRSQAGHVAAGGPAGLSPGAARRVDPAGTAAVSTAGRVPLPRLPAVPSGVHRPPGVPGRGRLVTRARGVDVVQVAWCDPSH